MKRTVGHLLIGVDCILFPIPRSTVDALETIGAALGFVGVTHTTICKDHHPLTTIGKGPEIE